LDDLSNCTPRNIDEFRGKLAGFVRGDIKDKKVLAGLFKHGFEVCVHLAASINVQDSIDDPQSCFDNNLVGTFNVLEECRKHRTKIVFMSSALIYRTAGAAQAIEEDHPLNPTCPYAASKISGEKLVEAYYKTYKLPAVILRPFSIYGPWQRSDSEGGVMSIFIAKMLKNEPILVFGDGEQSRDFFYIEDCAEFISRAAFSKKAIGEVFNAGSDCRVKIKDLAVLISNGKVKVKFVKHHHPHAEIMNMRASSKKSRALLGWKPTININEGIRRTTEWLRKEINSRP
jgi:UDP-glucose 4-epimerase